MFDLSAVMFELYYDVPFHGSNKANRFRREHVAFFRFVTGSREIKTYFEPRKSNIDGWLHKALGMADGLRKKDIVEGGF